MTWELKYYRLPKILLVSSVILAALLGLIISGFTPLDNALHLKTTVPYYVTVPTTVVKTVVNTTTLVINNTITTQVPVTSIITYTTPVIVNNTVTRNYTVTTTVKQVIIQETTETTTSPIIVTTPIYITITPTPPEINTTKAIYNTTYFTQAYTQYINQLQALNIVWLKPKVQFACYATGFRLPNDSSGLIIILVGNASSVDGSYGHIVPIQRPHGIEYNGGFWAVLGVNTTSATVADTYYHQIPLYVYWIGNATIAGDVAPYGYDSPPFPFNLPNGTYFAWLLNWNETGVIYPCILQVINAIDPNALLNTTYLGAQYWAVPRSTIYYGSPAPCYEPFEWTIGYWVWGINITEPIGTIWQYYCGANGIWRNMKP